MKSIELLNKYWEHYNSLLVNEGLDSPEHMKLCIQDYEELKEVALKDEKEYNVEDEVIKLHLPKSYFPITMRIDMSHLFNKKTGKPFPLQPETFDDWLSDPSNYKEILLKKV